MNRVGREGVMIIVMGREYELLQLVKSIAKSLEAIKLCQVKQTVTLERIADTIPEKVSNKSADDQR